jgi:NAD(P)-dependent dehydrogenase (short-subunit alcohol dehydrogenase family)
VELRDRIAVVTGGASGIGAAVSERLKHEGVRPVVWDVNPAAEVVCDVSDPAGVEAAVRATVDTVGVPTLMAACAGVGHSGLLFDVPPAEWDAVMGTNLKGAWLSMRAVAGAMRAAGGGRARRPSRSSSPTAGRGPSGTSPV